MALCRRRLRDAKTWTEHSDHVDAQAVLTQRAGAEACRQVGEEARPVSRVAAELGVCWWTVMNAVIEHGTPLVDDPGRIGAVTQLGVDETSFLSANRLHPTIYATGLVDLEAKVLIDMVEGNAAADLRRWTTNADADWIAGIEVVATDLAESFRAGLSPKLDHATRVADPFHVVRVGNRCLDKVRRRVQNETLGHRGRKVDPLYRIRKLLLAGEERLDDRGRNRMLLGLRVGDPHDEVLGAWLAKESVREVYLTDDPRAAALLLDKAIAGCTGDVVEEIRSLGHTLSSWRTEILAHHATGASNGPTEGLEPSGQAHQALRPRVQEVRALPAAGAPPRRRCHLAEPPPATSHPNALPSQTRRAEKGPGAEREKDLGVSPNRGGATARPSSYAGCGEYVSVPSSGGI